MATIYLDIPFNFNELSMRKRHNHIPFIHNRFFSVFILKHNLSLSNNIIECSKLDINLLFHS
ncbi:hypothetical protein J2X97_002239 [Epilithonimonas hungarica]|nr:hypothetical protein [Epilithonimonas hungarica]